jgi:uncharacterized protein (TIGR03437 family)
MRVIDINNLPYPGIRVSAVATPGGSLAGATLVSDESGRVQFQWTPSAANVNELRATIEGASPASAVVASALGRPAFAANAVVNAASFAPGLTPGSLATVFGANLAGGSTAQAGLPLPEQLAGVRVSIGGTPARLVYISDRQINFFVPSGVPSGTAELTVSSTLGASPTQTVAVNQIEPGVFFDVPSGLGAILIAGTAQTTAQRPATPGEVLEIYATGLGPTALDGPATTLLAPQVFVGLAQAPVLFSGLAPGFVGLYQVNALVPAGTPSGTQPVTLVMEGRRSNSVNVQIR